MCVKHHSIHSSKTSFMLRGPEEKFIVNFNCKVIVRMCVFGLSLI